MEERADKEAVVDRAPSRLSAISSDLSARALAFVKCIFPCRQNLFWCIVLEEEQEEINLLAWLPCRPRKHICKPDGHNVITCNSTNATVLS